MKNTPNNRRQFLRAAGAMAAAGMLASPAAASAAPAGGPLRIIGICGSHRKGKTTSTALAIALEAAKAVSPEIQTELIELSDYRLLPAVPGGTAEDDYGKIGTKITDPATGGIIFGTPVYFSNMTSMMKMFIEHFGPYKKGGELSNKVGGVLTVAGARNGGQEAAAQSIMAALLGVEMVLVGDGRPTGHSGATLWNSEKDQIEKDEWGCATARGLGKRVAEVALRMRS